jgi:hypothetical protein
MLMPNDRVHARSSQAPAAHSFGRINAASSTAELIPKISKVGDGQQPLSCLKAGVTGIQAETSAGGADAAITKSLSCSGVHEVAPLSPLLAPRSSGLELSAPATVSGPQQWHVAAGTMTEQQSPPGVHPHLPSSGPFERMDSASLPQVIESSPQRLAIGVHRERLGWVEIRTNSAAGQIAATLASGPGEPHNTISAQLPMVREYLAGEHVRVDTLASERFSQSPGGGGDSSGNQSRNGGARDMKAGETDASLMGSPVEVDVQGLSYINVRV